MLNMLLQISYKRKELKNLNYSKDCEMLCERIQIKQK